MKSQPIADSGWEMEAPFFAKVEGGRITAYRIRSYSQETAHSRQLRARLAVKVALLFGAIASVALAAFFVYGVGFRHVGVKFLLLYIGMFFGALVACVLATFGVYFITLVLSKRRFQREVHSVTLSWSDVYETIVDRQSPTRAHPWSEEDQEEIIRRQSPSPDPAFPPNREIVMA